jgi:hypothetical protein
LCFAHNSCFFFLRVRRYTVYKAITECSNKVIDFTNFLDLPDSMLDARFLFRRMGVHYQDSWFTPPGGEWNAGHRYLVSIVEQMGGDRSSPASVGKVKVPSGLALWFLFVFF